MELQPPLNSLPPQSYVLKRPSAWTLLHSMVSAKVSLVVKSFEELFLWTASPPGQNLRAADLECGRGSLGGTPLFCKRGARLSPYSYRLASPGIEPLDCEGLGWRPSLPAMLSIEPAPCEWGLVEEGSTKLLATFTRNFDCNWELGEWQMLVASLFQWDSIPWLGAEGKVIPIFLAPCTWSKASLTLIWGQRKRGQIVALVPSILSVLTKT